VSQATVIRSSERVCTTRPLDDRFLPREGSVSTPSEYDCLNDLSYGRYTCMSQVATWTQTRLDELRVTEWSCFVMMLHSQ
jgi:hypothetical protein